MASTVQARTHRGIVVMIVLAGLAFAVAPVGLGLGVVVFAPWATGLKLLGVFLIGVGVLVAWLMSRTNGWVELDGATLREHRLLTREEFEWPVEQVSKVTPLRSGGGDHLRDAVLDHLLQTRNRGFQLEMSGRHKINLVRGDMGGIDEFMLALRDRLGPRRWAEVLD